MNILMAAPEMEPYAWTGGLGDVIGALPGALAAEGHKVSVILPLYRAIERWKYDLKPYGGPRNLSIFGREETYQLFRTVHGQAVEVYLVDQPHYFDREGIYGYQDGDFQDNAERFIFFSRCAVELAASLRPAPHVVHAHDWQAALVPVYMANMFREVPRFRKMVSVFTIHNIGYQGLFPAWMMELTGLDGSLFNPEGLEFHDRLNLLKGGIAFSDAVTTVSARYAEEIQSEQYGFGLEGVLHDHRGKLRGILNGVNYEAWDPATDKLLKHNYSPGELSGKALCKQELQKKMGLPARPRVPLFGMVTRLAEQKGFDLLAGSAGKLMALDIQLVILGTGDERYEKLVGELCGRYPENIACRIAFDNGLSHLVQAGSDFFLMPSRYEPCGLSQIYSLKYGTIPVVRATGGLDDTVIDVRTDPERGTGFKFDDYSPEALVNVLADAVSFYRNAGPPW
ncbi:MAG: glycogen synthase GlgA, partial [Gemmatimonadota bacterium]|nr:glycogen synthase GlgA [Gemmatimonadota bacterium]